ncbi:hypothetical protein QYE76_000752 [Lolium multiflorum]|uniref:F-box domain-containing protein n=1 Tax=Lolium multiflorum TaxID=4521 RepID=A0AAD8RKR0_LOLMU|nr:hypothetical protein QYE76_000752 [Lolium multiflorum]
MLRMLRGRPKAQTSSSHHCSPAPAPAQAPAPKTPLDDEDLLQEILLRLPPNPSSLPRASLVCKGWRSILSDPEFLERFRKHHHTPPLLGFFAGHVHATPVFTPILDSPNRIPASRFPVPQSHSRNDEWRFMGCRHGLAVLLEVSRREAVVWHPLTGQRRHVSFPPGMHTDDWNRWHAAVQCADAADGHVHGDCFSNPFKLVLILVAQRVRAFACLYESASGAWGDIASTATRDTICYTQPSVLIGNAFCWLLGEADILAFDIQRQSLGVIEKPNMKRYFDSSVRLFRTQDNGPGLACLSKLTIQLWERKSYCDGVVGWEMLQKTIKLKGLFPRRMRGYDKLVYLSGYDEDTNAIVLTTETGNFTLQLDSAQIRHIIKRDYICDNTFYPYTNFYTAGRGVGWKWVDQKL